MLDNFHLYSIRATIDGLPQLGINVPGGFHVLGMEDPDQSSSPGMGVLKRTSATVLA